MKDNIYSRRQFISKYLSAGTMFFGGAFMFISMKAAAKNKGLKHGSPDQQVPKNASKGKAKPKVPAKAKQADAPDPCDDYTGVSAEDLAKRKKLAYVNKSPIPDSHCGNCALHLPPADGKTCGGCMLFKGPVRTTGYCTYWAPIANNN